MKKFILTATICLIIPIALFAQEKKEIFQGTFFEVRETIKINQEIAGDVIVMAKTLEINAKVNGDVIAVAESININADIEGNLRVACKNITIISKISKNVNIIAIDIDVAKNAVLEKDVLVYSKLFQNSGTIKGNINLTGENIEIGNSVEGNTNIKIRKGGKLIIRPDTNIEKNLSYTATEKINISDSVKIGGEIIYKEAPLEKRKSINVFGKLVSLFGMIALGMIVIIIDRKNTMRASGNIIKKPSSNMLWGSLYFIAIPAISFILLFTIIGIPIALILFSLYLILLYVAQVFTGIAIGSAFFKKNINNDILKMSLGLLILMTLTSLPAIGFALRLIAIFIGMGAIINTKKEMLKKENNT